MASARPNVSDETATVKNEQREELTLLSLPDVVLLHVLSCLPVDDVVAAGMAIPRLGALTRTCSLWRSRTLSPMIERTMKDAGGILAFLRVLPPISDFVFTFRKELAPCCSVYGIPVRKLKAYIKAPLEMGLVVIQQLGPSLQHLEVYPVRALDLLFFCLRQSDCSSLESLQVTFRDATSAPWPQKVKLPKLHSLKFCGILHTSGAVIEDLKSLVRAHSGQLRSVSLSEALFPLLLECPRDLHRLRVPAVRGRGLARGLKNMWGLKELHVDMSNFSTHNSPDPALTELVEFLGFQRRGFELERLVLWESSPKTLIGLLPDRLAGVRLKHLELCSSFHFVNWQIHPQKPIVLGPLLCRLRSLTLRGFSVPLCPVLGNISAAEIPHLELLLLSSDLNLLEDLEKERGHIFRNLVRRAPTMKLHTLLLGRDGVELRICRHPSWDLCDLCTEAADILHGYYVHDGYRSNHPTEVRHDQVL